MLASASYSTTRNPFLLLTSSTSRPKTEADSAQRDTPCAPDAVGSRDTDAQSPTSRDKGCMPLDLMVSSTSAPAPA